MALLDTTQARIGSDQLDDAETLLDAATELNSAAEGLVDVRAALEDAYVEAQSSTVVSTRNLAYVTTVSPRYPRRAMERDIAGWVIIDFTVTTEGETSDVTVRQSEPGKVFNDAAIKAVEQWVFEPVIYRGQVINQRAASRLVFNLE